MKTFKQAACLIVIATLLGCSEQTPFEKCVNKEQSQIERQSVSQQWALGQKYSPFFNPQISLLVDQYIESKTRESLEFQSNFRSHYQSDPAFASAVMQRYTLENTEPYKSMVRDHTPKLLGGEISTMDYVAYIKACKSQPDCNVLWQQHKLSQETIMDVSRNFPSYTSSQSSAVLEIKILGLISSHLEKQAFQDWGQSFNSNTAQQSIEKINYSSSDKRRESHAFVKRMLQSMTEAPEHLAPLEANDWLDDYFGSQEFSAHVKSVFAQWIEIPSFEEIAGRMCNERGLHQ